MLTLSKKVLNQFRKLRIHLVFFSSVKPKLIPPLQILNSIFRNTGYFKKILVIVEESFFFISDKILIVKCFKNM